jgi:hypothetical protein
MKALLDTGGALGALLSAVAAPCCFPLLAPLGGAFGFGVLLPWTAYALYGVAACAVVAMVGNVAAFRAHRRLAWLLLGVGSGLLVVARVGVCWTPRISGRGSGQSCARPPRVVHGDAQQHDPAAVSGGSAGVKQAWRPCHTHAVIPCDTERFA